jgi:hypothetical protein
MYLAACYRPYSELAIIRRKAEPQTSPPCSTIAAAALSLQRSLIARRGRRSHQHRYILYDGFDSFIEGRRLEIDSLKH